VASRRAMGTDELDDHVKAFLEKYSWDAYPSKHLKYFEVGAFDLETSLATDEVVHITDQKVDDADCENLSKALCAMKPVNMKDIYLTNNTIGDAGCASVAEAAAELPSFGMMYMAQNKIGDAGLKAIAEKLPKSKMWQLILSENKIGDAGLSALAQAATKDPDAFSSLRWLFLDANEIGDKGVGDLAKALVKSFQALERLALQDNKLTNAALYHLVKAIGAGALPNCQYLYVQNNQWDKVGRNALKAVAKPRGIKVHFGWPPPLPGVDYD